LYTIEKTRRPATDDSVEGLIAQAEAILNYGEDLRHQGYPIERLAADLYDLRRHNGLGHKRRASWHAARVQQRVDQIESRA